MQTHKSHLLLQFGQAVEGKGKWHIDLHAQFSATAAQQQLDWLKQSTDGNLDTEWSLVLCFDSQPGKAEELEAALKELARVNNVDDDFTLKSWIQKDQVWVSLRAVPDSEQEFLEGFNMVYNQGLNKIPETENNTIDLSISSNYGFDQIKESFEQNERVLSIFLRSLQLRAELDLDPQLAQILFSTLEQFDPELAEEPLVKAITKFRNFKVNLQFMSSEEVPEIVRKFGFIGREVAKKINDGHGGFKNEQVQVEAVNQVIGSRIKAYFTIPEFVTVNLELNLPGSGVVIASYGNALLSVLNI